MLKVRNQPPFQRPNQDRNASWCFCNPRRIKDSKNYMLDTRISDKSQDCGTWTDVISEVKNEEAGHEEHTKTMEQSNHGNTPLE